METKRDYMNLLADLTGKLDAVGFDDPNRFFKPTLETMARDSARWIDNEWKSPNGDTAPIERAIVVLTQDLVVLLGHAVNAKIKHEFLVQLARGAVEAAEADIIEDQSHKEFFLHPDSPMQTLIADNI